MESNQSKQKVRQSKKGSPAVHSMSEGQESPAPCVRMRKSHSFIFVKSAEVGKPTLSEKVEALGGELWLESAGQGKGFTWWVRLPTKRQNVEREQA